MSEKEFREDLRKLMPGYKWVVHKAGKRAVILIATGTRSSGSNRLCTVKVQMTNRDNAPAWYQVWSAPYGTKTPWAGEGYGTTMARAFRSLQDHYVRRAAKYNSLANSLQAGRSKETPTNPPHP